MTLASRLADQIATDYGRDPWKIAERLNLPIYEERLPAGLTELYVEELGNNGVQGIILARGLSEQAAREMLAHALAHHLLHVGNRLARTPSALWSGRHEREADDFAALLLVSQKALALLVAEDAENEADLADRFDVTPALMRRRLALFQKQQLDLDVVSMAME